MRAVVLCSRVSLHFVGMNKHDLRQFNDFDYLDFTYKLHKEIWGDRRGLNPRQPESQSGALPTELRPPQ
jgi:hypothetical protein